ncbi:uncharacterized protein LOC117580959 isoform X2 [Drosophila guanche]|uniref:Uncharacterized protein n=1 Tax=Drosophila guanche TaxID=7266 RepID=A0A3B0K014_DROGU|nr:uncharacterized protein LOC117580959 isoform X2 [Drosophila guanche]SPP78341.1 Hypothetical predicted protein [Drosophila guanche]
MNPYSHICVPLFLLFALILASIWGFINREELLDAYRKQLHGEAKHVKISRLDFINMFAQLNEHTSEVHADQPLHLAAVKNISLGNVTTIQNLTQIKDLEDKDEGEDVLVLEDYQQEDEDDDDDDEQQPATGSTENPLSEMPKVVQPIQLPMSTDSNLKREFASDNANPYIEGINDHLELFCH